VAYRLRLPSRLAAIHNVFHISQLKKCVRVPTEIIDQQEILVEPDLSYTEYPLKILDQKERGTRRKVLKMYKIQWSHHTEEEATWETEDYLNRHYPGFLSSTSGISFFPASIQSSNLGTRFFLRGVGCDTSGVNTLKSNQYTLGKVKRKIWETNSKRKDQIKYKSYKRN
jgi:hypothetical protein